ncbi:MAG: hypothetical protein EB003_11150 [Flavobacteriia bacterium]|nr:hypothetical protein [Flavobacteriia bacterium]
MSLFNKRRVKILVPNQEAAAIAHFRQLISQWRRQFSEDNWPTVADHLHELLHRAMIVEGAKPDWIAFAISRPPPKGVAEHGCK